MKVKYIDKRHWRRIIDREYTEVKVNNNKYKGIIGLVTMKKVREPLEVSVVGQNIVVADDNYQWLQILPEKKRYSITVMLDDKGNPLEYYFDINIKNVTQKGNARTIDLCLDVLVLPNGEYELVDEDDLQRALDQGQITRKQYHEAYVIAHQLMIKIDEDFKTMQDKIMYCYHKIKHKPKAKKPYKHPKHKKNERNHHGHKPKHAKHKQHPNYVSNTQNKQIDSKEQN
ncbi:DUF402 domain-containing protein [Staphylococcus gallinarum]|uniref:Protein of uncharacterized function (DUF402) n=1 Tax=Staphylococcus gallinarum TaxID=1293 RepID=A0A0D0SQ37_STAGA|nr:DUF402 domain-containing protein [Staphylococcus gallinarum]KIR12563.1 hypothetical protein SH09_03025 [Staphylococcus gallinarum]MCD8843744.1 DUF402 domain-containing protein [Staphylococcus gallinarum]MCD8909952.1 DUF402 domain-containing protein [Staphylococcus gallinarum]SUM31859.1 Protein of uncharacterised function (DUF402) [Staphylococcus gallinarum]GEQ04389.1 hypothetical protein SGA02_02170 [Staphylococcus gallinarum]